MIKKRLCIIAAIMMMTCTIVLGGCSNRIMNELTKKGYFANSYDNAVAQTDIAKLFTNHFADTNNKKKALLVAVDGFRVESFKYIFDRDLGMSQIAKSGGLYWTKPVNIKTKAQVDIGVNFLSIVTGKEPSTFNVLKSTDAKRETPLSIMSTISNNYSVKFLTDNKNYIDVQMEEEFAAKNSRRLTYADCKDMSSLRTECIKSFDNSDFVCLAVSTPYNVAKANFSMSNAEYLSTLIHLNYNIGEIYRKIQNRVDEDWLVVVASTCGGRNKLAGYDEEGNVLTFMISNQKVQ
ncbi:MAG: hypothetical protein K2P12_02280 [Clostridia bacterium]|nr:hypothetical protein [Clostridia bacterium]